MNKVKKMEIQNAPVFDLSKLEFLDKLGEGTVNHITYIVGAFGKVRLAKKVKDCDTSTDTEDSSPDEIKVKKHLNPEHTSSVNDNLCAIKILSKHQIIKAKQVDHVFNEMCIQATLNHPFIVL